MRSQFLVDVDCMYSVLELLLFSIHVLHHLVSWKYSVFTCLSSKMSVTWGKCIPQLECHHVTWAVLTGISGFSKERGCVMGHSDSVRRGYVVIFHCIHSCMYKFSTIPFISICCFPNSVIWIWQYSALINSKQLRLSALDLYKIKPVNIPAWPEAGACEPLHSN